jgi:hypothetical protein
MYNVLLTMENHGDAYRMLVRVRDVLNDRDNMLRKLAANTCAIDELVRHAGQHHNCTPSYLHWLAMRVVLQWLDEQEE